MESKLFESILRLKEDTAMAYAEHLARELKRNDYRWDNFNVKVFNNNRMKLDNKIVYGGGLNHKGEETEPILANFIDDVVKEIKIKKLFKLTPEIEQRVRGAAEDYYVRKLGHR